MFPRLTIALFAAWLFAGVGAGFLSAAGGEYPAAGPLFQGFRLTLEPGQRQEALGPFWSREELWEKEPEGLTDPLAPPAELTEVQVKAATVVLAPVYSWYQRKDVEAETLQLLYPILTYSRFGDEERFQVLQILSFAGGREQNGGLTRRFTLFPLYFEQRADDPALNYTGLMPLFGTVKKRLFRDEVRWVMWPLYVQTRKGDTITDNYVAPFVHVRHGDQLGGWQFWPFYGTEHQEPHVITNRFGDAELRGGHDTRFVLWPFYTRNELETGTTNLVHQRGVLPFFNYETSAAYQRRTYLWPIGLSQFDNYATGYRQRSLGWPLFIRGRGPGTTVDRAFPFYGVTHAPGLDSTLVLWPLYRYKNKQSSLLDFHRTSFLFFLYTDSSLRDKSDGRVRRRTDLWPFFIKRRDADGNQRFQMLAPIEPLIVDNAGIQRTWSPMWSVWRSQKNGKTGAASHSLLWNLYRAERAPGVKKCSLFFGLIQYCSTSDGARWRWFYLPAHASGGGGLRGK